MKYLSRLMTLTALVAVTLLPTLASATSWKIDPEHSSIQFKVRHLMVSNVKGVFGRVSGTIEIDDRDITKSRAGVTIETASIDTGVAKRDAHLKSADFFDVAKFPVMTFVAKRVTKSGDGLKVAGELTIRGITREVVLDVEGPTPEVKDPWGNYRRGASATTKIDRRDFGLTWNKALETGGVVVGDEVTINLEVELIKKP